MDNRHTFRLLVDPRPGIMIRVALVLERRGFTITFMELAEDALEQGLHEMVIKAYGEEAKLEQIEKQLAKVVDVAEAELRSPVHVKTPAFIEQKAVA
ncbi:ACT domain-containing protein [Cytophagaceae bacterium ABcell3]|nr:ACT domain-containing protein [Cytophagaceae bacterium ABcell3]